MTSNPDKIIALKSDFCQSCANDLTNLAHELLAKRQEIILPPIKPIYVEYRQFGILCSCGVTFVGLPYFLISSSFEFGEGIVSYSNFFMKNQIKTHYFKTPVGELILGSFEGKLCLADWKYRKMRNAIDKRIKTALEADFVEQNSAVIELCKIQLNEYFQNQRTEFDIPLLFVGTDFQKQVWNALLQVPYGISETYLGLSKILENQKAIRAVATANGANAISIIVPCHRIIGSKGDLVGYAGGLPAKKKLLDLEGALKTSQLDLF